MKKVLLFAALAMVLVASAAAQLVAPDAYQVNYYSNRNNTAGLDQTTRLINPGTRGTPITPINPTEGIICANIYVFDSTQEMQECCSCPITANGILTESLITNLTQNPLTGLPASNSGVIKIISSQGAPVCGFETRPELVGLVAKLLGWQTHVQQPTAGTFVVTEDGFKDSSFNINFDPTTDEAAFLGQACSFVQYLGSGKGRCTCGNVS